MEKLTNTAEKLAAFNQYNQNYHFKTPQPFVKNSFNYSEESKYTKMLVEKDLEILNRYQANFLEVATDEPRNGDALILPTGETVYFCHTLENSVQTTPGGSYNLSKSGYLSYSGGLDSGINKNDIYLTDELTTLQIWFSHGGYLCAGSAIYAIIKTRVWKCKEGADLSGIQTKRNY